VHEHIHQLIIKDLSRGETIASCTSCHATKFCLCVNKIIQARQLEFLYTCRHFVALTSKIVAMRMALDGLVLDDSSIILV